MKFDELIDKTLEQVSQFGYKQSTLNWIRYGRFSSIRNYFTKKGQDCFCINVAHDYVAEIQQKCDNGEISKLYCTHLKKRVSLLEDVYTTGEINWRYLTTSKIKVNAYFEGIMNDYLESRRPFISVGTLGLQKSNLLNFLGFLEKIKKVNDFYTLSLQDIQDHILRIVGNHRGSMGNVIYTLKYFILYLKDKGIVDTDLTLALQKPTQNQRKILPYFTHEEIRCILDQVDRNTPIGKRDYALLLLARNTGLRAIDIVNLKLTDIDWQNDEVHIIQQKTGHMLILPLESDTENAIMEYILNGRPTSDSQYIFLRGVSPYNELAGSQIVGAIFRKYLKLAGFPHVAWDGKSFHALRRSIGTWMLEAEVPLTTISQVLGHKSLNSAKPYLSTNDKKLRECTLSLDGIAVSMEELL